MENQNMIRQEVAFPNRKVKNLESPVHMFRGHSNDKFLLLALPQRTNLGGFHMLDGTCTLYGAEQGTK